MTIVQSKCKCHKSPGEYKSIEADWLVKLEEYKRIETQNQTIDKVIEMLNKQQDVYFHLTLTAGSATYWRNKIQTIERIIIEVNNMRESN